jgi:hypothetical protein
VRRQCGAADATIITMSGQLLDVARTLLPDVPLGGARVARGQFHDVVLLPGTAAVRVARSPAVDAACLAWHGWDTVRAAVDADTYGRACVWFRTFGLEQVSAALLLGDPPERYVDRAVAWLERGS